MRIGITYTVDSLREKAQAFGQTLDGSKLFREASFKDQFNVLLTVTESGLSLSLITEPFLKPIIVDFFQGVLDYRCRRGGGRRHQLLSRAVGLHKKKQIKIFDATAGFGNDAFLLAYLGGQVTMIERSPVISALLSDALQRAKQFDQWKKISLQLVMADAADYLRHLSRDQRPEVIYLDPMYPGSKHAALNKKEMRILRSVVGEDEDAGNLMHIARLVATERVVVKRSRLAPVLAEQKPDRQLKGKSTRFDIYKPA